MGEGGPLDIIVTSDDDSLVNYPGGKGKCFHHLINLMPPHRVYIESHLGGGACMRNKRPADVNIGIDLDERVIDRWRAEHEGLCHLVTADAATFLASHPFTGDELVYADPPYVASTRRRPAVYRCEYAIDDHINLLDVLSRLPCMVLVSGYYNELYAKTLAGWRHVSFRAMTHRGSRLESVWANFPEPYQLHDTRFLGDNFRERQSSQRRHRRLLDKLERMSGPERQHVISLIRERFDPGQGTQ